MTYGAFPQDFAAYDRVERSRKPIPQAALCALALTLGTSVGLWALYAGTHTTPQTEVASQQATMAPAPKIDRTIVERMRREAARQAAVSAKFAATGVEPLHVAQGPIPSVLQAVAKREPMLLAPSLTSGYTASTFAQSAPLRSGFAQRVAAGPGKAPPIKVAAVAPAVVVSAVVASLVETTPQARDVPLPLPRPASLAAMIDKGSPAVADRRIVRASYEPGNSPAPAAIPRAAPGPAQKGFFEKMFGEARPPGTALAYATPEDGGLGGLFGGSGRRPAGGYDQWTAVYDITAHTVTLPDGTRLEAHSGLGPYKDNPASVAMRMVGVTPPNLYQLTFREAPFHGVRALRLTPLGGTTYGRAGLLAHTYMLRGRNGDSNGCVVFKDYDRFLRAFESGAIRRLAVVPRAG